MPRYRELQFAPRGSAGFREAFGPQAARDKLKLIGQAGDKLKLIVPR